MNKIGKFGEDIACLFLMKHGFKIIERNYFKKWGELDIVARKNGCTYFIEVKTVSCEMSTIGGKFVTHGTLYRPEDNMHPAKSKRFLRIVQTYMLEKGIANKDWRLSLIAIRVDVDKKRAKIRFIEDLIL